MTRRSTRLPRLILPALLALGLVGSAGGHDPLLDLPAPRSAPEAWDVIRQSVDNVGKLLETNQLKAIAIQVANCSPAIRALQADLKDQPDKADLGRRLEALYEAGGAVITASREREQPRARAEERYRAYRALWDAVAAEYPPAVRQAAVYNCPMHPLDRHVDPAAPCTLCGMKLVRRRIPSSTAYEAPGQPSMTLTATPDAPLRAGTRANVRVRLARRDGTPVGHRDLLTMHTEKVHLLIVDPSLSDYHHEHPTPVEGAGGEYAFAFTPRRPGPYRIFADVVPAATGVQEYVVADVPAAADAGPGGPIDDRADRFATTVDGLRYELVLHAKAEGTAAVAHSAHAGGSGGGHGGHTGGGVKVRAREVVAGEVRVTGPDGQPFTALEPVMGAFAHVVGFAEDYRTVVHIHPLGAEPTKPEERGGPVLRFNFYAPTPGYYRLYVQVCIGGSSRFAPLGVNVLPAGAEGTSRGK